VVDGRVQRVQEAARQKHLVVDGRVQRVQEAARQKHLVVDGRVQRVQEAPIPGCTSQPLSRAL
jgi:hypothetical protein